MAPPFNLLTLLEVVLLCIGRATGQSHQIQDLRQGTDLDIQHSRRVVGISAGFGFHFERIT